MDKPHRTIAEQLRTLDEKANALPPPPAGPYPIPPALPHRTPAGHWRAGLAHRPNAWRRFWMWALLGWRWFPYPD